MLRKLIKHEFRATARIMGPLFLIMLVLSLLANLSLRFLMDSRQFLLNILGVLMLAAFGIGMAALIIMAIVLMVNRFKSNLMGDEGYIMFTLPASSHQIVWSKIIVSTVWFVATGVVEVLSGLICAMDLKLLKELFSTESFHQMMMLLQEAIEKYGVNVPAVIFEFLLLCLLSCAVMCLGFYAALATGHSFANHKMLLSVAFFFGFQFALQFLGSVVSYGMSRMGLFDWNMNFMSTMGQFHLMMLVMLGSELLVGAIYYGITTVMLKKHLNLQ